MVVGVQERVDIYKTYLMFCMTGDVVNLPMGGTIVVERDEKEFARLSQLGDILGLGPMDVYTVCTCTHTCLSTLIPDCHARF